MDQDYPQNIETSRRNNYHYISFLLLLVFIAPMILMGEYLLELIGVFPNSRHLTESMIVAAAIFEPIGLVGSIIFLIFNIIKKTRYILIPVILLILFVTCLLPLIYLVLIL